MSAFPFVGWIVGNDRTHVDDVLFDIFLMFKQLCFVTKDLSRAMENVCRS